MDIGLVCSPAALKYALKAIKIIQDLGANVILESDSSKLLDLKLEVFEGENDAPRKVVVIGGDGTLLRFLHKFKRRCPDILTVRAGRRAYLLELEPHELELGLKRLLSGDYLVYLAPRVMVEERDWPYALNEVALIAQEGKMCSLKVSVGDNVLYSVDGDGIVVAPTLGSTAYSLSAGGPIVDRRLRAVTITPLNPLQLYVRPVVVPIDSRITIAIGEERGAPLVVIDGQFTAKIRRGETLSITEAPTPVRLVQVMRKNYYERIFAKR